MKLELPISTSYVPTWGAIEGLREILQNARDASVEHGAEFRVSYNAEKQRLVVRTDGATIDRKALVLGFTSKRNRKDLIGEHGEGLALGLLALCRDQLKTTIRVQNETWIPTLRYSEKWDEVVLCFDIRRSASTDQPRVWVQVDGVTGNMYDELRSRILWFPGSLAVRATIETSDGTILTDVKERGRIYAKGIFVQHIEDYCFGYNFNNLRVDRDRGMVDGWDVSYAAACTIAIAVANDKISPADFVKMCESDIADTRRVDLAYKFKYDLALQKRVADAWLEHVQDPDAIPVTDDNQVRELSYWNLRGRVVHSQGLRDILTSTLKRDAHTAIQNAASSVTRTYELWEITNEEATTLNTALTILRNANCINDEKLCVVDFASSTMYGMWRRGFGAYISRRVLSNLADTLRTIVHELAHDVSDAGDGSHEFEAALEKMWSSLVMSLIKSQDSNCVTVGEVVHVD